MAVEENEEIKKTVEVLDELSMDPEERAMYEYREKAEMDYIDAVSYLQEKGLEEGRKEGEKKAKIETAKKMLEKGMNIEIIIEITELTKEEINALEN